MIIHLLKLGCLFIYAGALASLMGWKTSEWGQWQQTIALALLVIHVIEMPFVFPALRRYRGPLAVSLLLSLLFGLLHWQPLRKSQA